MHKENLIMSDKEFKTADEWVKLKNQETYPVSVVIVEASGWDGNWDESISKIEFELRLAKSKVMYQNTVNDGENDDLHDHIPGID